ncbi:MAG: DUF2812 domain-containing protein, partial [Muribaculaceae bacterium]|nr:DUF2812 domain-containing protein [Muribaculaceae bacterium]
MSENFEYKKNFADLDSEERWLNEMSEKGLAMKSVSGAFIGSRYSFEKSEKAYTYRVDYSPDGRVMEEITSPYVMFVKDTYGAEYVCCSGGKVYFRKAIGEGDFPPVYTTDESRLNIEKRKFWQFVFLIGAVVAEEVCLKWTYYAVLFLFGGHIGEGALFLLAAAADWGIGAYCVYSLRRLRQQHTTGQQIS